MDQAREKFTAHEVAKLARVLRPALPAVIGAAALTFLFFAVIPVAWISAMSWNLYLDRLSDLFAPPVGNGGRLVLAVGMSAITAMIAGFAVLLCAKPAHGGEGASDRRAAARAKRRASVAEALPRRRADAHPDDSPRPPIRAGRDLPAGGLGPYFSEPRSSADMKDGMFDPSSAQIDALDEGDGEDELILADLAPVDYAGDDADAPWLQPVETAGPPKPDPSDHSLGAMVARFEAGLAHRRKIAATLPVPATPSAEDNSEPAVDFALEAALSTLQRMSRRAVG